jgi:hypothetical protein
VLVVPWSWLRRGVLWATAFSLLMIVVHWGETGSPAREFGAIIGRLLGGVFFGALFAWIAWLVRCGIKRDRSRSSV